MLLQIKKILSVSLAFWIIFTTSSFVVRMHYCCNELVDIAVFTKENTCKSLFSEKEQPYKLCTIDESSCCSYTVFTHEGNDKIKKYSFKIVNKVQLYFNSSHLLYLNTVKLLEKKDSLYKDYFSPKVTKNRSILYQVYII